MSKVAAAPSAGAAFTAISPMTMLSMFRSGMMTLKRSAAGMSLSRKFFTCPVHHFSDIATASKPAIRHGVPDETDEDDDYDLRSPAGSVRGQIADRQQTPTVAPWKEHLSALRRVAAVTNPSIAPEAEQRIVYVIDVQECLAAGRLILQTPVSRLKKNGELGRPNFHDPYIRDTSQLESADRQILALLSGSASQDTRISVRRPKRNEPATDQHLAVFESIPFAMLRVTACSLSHMTSAY